MAPMDVNIQSELKKDYPRLFTNEIEMQPPCVLGNGGKFEIYEVDFLSKSNHKKFVTKYVFNNNGEIWTFDNIEDALSTAMPEIRRHYAKLIATFILSPIIISGALAVVMVLLIAYLLINQMPVPSQLWSIFTAIVAFYFGKEGWSAIRHFDSDR